MKTLLLTLTLFLFSTAAYIPTSDRVPILNKGISVVEFNASFNSSNSVGWMDKLSDCEGRRIDIVSDPLMQKEHKIVVVPTIIIFNEGEEVKRFQANIMMQLEASQSDVQDVIDNIIMSAF
tara:strand:- start:831 stop:1193 length:363 start_codon:yes stop_codon:yes gene_type:complete